MFTPDNDFRKILQKYSIVLKPTYDAKDVKHSIKHQIITKGHPVRSKARRLTPEKFAAAK